MELTRKIFALLGAALLILMLAGCKGKEKWTPEDGLSWIPTDLASATKMINDKCPEWVDPETRLDSAVLLHDSLTFFYSLPNKVRNTFDPNAFQAFLIPEIVDNIRGNSRLDLHRDSSIFMVFNYRDRNGDFVTSFVVTPAMYYKPEPE